MNFGTSREFPSEGSREKRLQKKTKERKPLPERMDAFERIVQLCGVRDRSSAELLERLEKDGYESETSIHALHRATECGLVDDMRFADAFIRGKISAGKGISYIERQLDKHGLKIEDISGWPEEYGLGDEHDEVSRAFDYLCLHAPRSKDLWAGAYRKLASRGFSPNVCSKATRLWIDAKG